MKSRKAFLAASLAAVLLLCGCTQDSGLTLNPNETQNSGNPSGGNSGSGTAAVSDQFTDRDREGDYNKSEANRIVLSGDCASSGSGAVSISGSTVTITAEGTYVLSGTLDDGMIIVDTDKSEKVQLVLDGVSIHSGTSAPIYIRQADKVFITLSQNSENTLSNGGSFQNIDDNNIDAVIFSKDDLTLNGTGSLTITSPAGHGVVSKDELTVAGGSYTITCASHGLSGKDNLCLTGAEMTITSGKDGLHAENDDDEALGYLVIESGSYTITAQGDGISAGSYLQILDGSFAIVSGGGSVNGEVKTSENWGGFGGGPGGMGGGRPGGGMDGRGDSSSGTASEDSTSIKGIKAGGDLTISGGSFRIDSADDAVHSNANAGIHGGVFTISTGDDGFHADENLAISGGTVTITESYEGLEGLSIDITGGDMVLKSTDDGLNAAGGTDQSGFGGFRGGDMFGSGGSSDSYIRISGGSLSINASGDGIDSNGYLEITGGSITVCGPTQGDTAVLDYDTTGTISGGTFIGTGSYMMAQTLSSADTQGVIALSVGNQTAGTRITLTDSAGNVIIDHTPELNFAIVILSSPDILVGETYTITVGSASGDFEAQ